MTRSPPNPNLNPLVASTAPDQSSPSSCHFTTKKKHRRAQELNNEGVDCIEAGNYPQAMSCFVEALRFTPSRPCLTVPYRGSSSSTSIPSCPCDHCSLEFSVVYSSSRSSSSATPITRSMIPLDGTNDHEIEGGYVYTTPLYISSEAMECGHAMPAALPLILTFNLALVHHLNILARPSRFPSLIEWQKVLRLYQLAYRWHLQEPDPQVESLLFTMMISNNLAQIHRRVSNHHKHQACLEHLLSTLVTFVDSRQYSLEERSPPWTSTVEPRIFSSSTATPPSSSSSSSLVLEPSILDGFFQNTLALMLQDSNTAKAA